VKILTLINTHLEIEWCMCLCQVQNKRRRSETDNELLDYIAISHTKSNYSTTKLETFKYNYFGKYSARVQHFQNHSTLTFNVLDATFCTFSEMSGIVLVLIFPPPNTVTDSIIAFQALCNSL
jgi:hypothetical protein